MCKEYFNAREGILKIPSRGARRERARLEGREDGPARGAALRGDARVAVADVVLAAGRADVVQPAFLQTWPVGGAKVELIAPTLMAEKVT